LLILKNNLLNHFQGAASSEAYFGSQQLTKKEIKNRLGKRPYVCPG
jgi:hypothetical protein